MARYHRLMITRPLSLVGRRELFLFLGAYLLYSTSRYVSVGRHHDGHRPRPLGRRPAEEHRRQRRELGAGGARRHRGDLDPQQPVPAAQIVVVPGTLIYLYRRNHDALRQAAQHGPGDLADRDADLRPLPRRPAAARRHRHARHDHQRRRRPARLRADDLLLQPAGRRAEPARRASRSPSASRWPPTSATRSRSCWRGRGRRSSASPSSPPATTSSSTSPPASS